MDIDILETIPGKISFWYAWPRPKCDLFTLKLLFPQAAVLDTEEKDKHMDSCDTSDLGMLYLNAPAYTDVLHAYQSKEFLSFDCISLSETSTSISELSSLNNVPFPSLPPSSPFFLPPLLLRKHLRP